MPVYEYFCPQCSRELEVLRPTQRASEYSDCPNCGGKACRLVSGFGSKTGSYLQPSGMPFRDEFGLQPSRSETVATATMDDVHVDLLVEGQQESLPVEMSWLLESQPNGSNIWFIHNWGIASILRYLREDLDTEPAERMRYLEEVMGTRPAEGPLDYAPEVDQRVEYPSVRPWPEEKVAEPIRPRSLTFDWPTIQWRSLPNHGRRHPVSDPGRRISPRSLQGLPSLKPRHPARKGCVSQTLAPDILLRLVSVADGWHCCDSGAARLDSGDVCLGRCGPLSTRPDSLRWVASSL